LFKTKLGGIIILTILEENARVVLKYEVYVKGLSGKLFLVEISNLYLKGKLICCLNSLFLLKGGFDETLCSGQLPQ
jgi:hypothetical protein